MTIRYVLYIVSTYYPIGKVTELMKGELESLGEEYENVETISKIQTQILNQTHGYVNIFDDTGNFKSTYEILKGIAEVWDHISQTDQAALLETIAGKQRGNQIAALIQSFQSGQVEKAFEASKNAAGSAMQEQERWMESLEAKTAQFEAAFQSLSSTVLNSDLLKWFVDFGTNTVKVFDTVIDKIGSLGTIGLGAGIFSSIKNVGGWKNVSPICYLFLKMPTIICVLWDTKVFILSNVKYTRQINNRSNMRELRTTIA